MSVSIQRASPGTGGLNSRGASVSTRLRLSLETISLENWTVMFVSLSVCPVGWKRTTIIPVSGPLFVVWATMPMDTPTPITTARKIKADVIDGRFDTRLSRGFIFLPYGYHPPMQQVWGVKVFDSAVRRRCVEQCSFHCIIRSGKADGSILYEISDAATMLHMRGI
jgi:hypothetical protein